MSYDIVLLRRRPGRSWEEVLEAQEEALAVSDGGAEERPPTLETRSAWERIVSRAREILGDVTVGEYGSRFELDHAATGIQLSLEADSAGISVPYWTHGDAAADVLERIYRLAVVVERETGLEGYDPQLGAAVSELTSARRDAAVSIFGKVAKMFDRRGS